MPTQSRGAAALSLLFVVISWSGLSTPTCGQEVWSGLTYSFTKPDGADGSLPQYQDELTPGVTFARGNSGGLFNPAAGEPSYLRSVSPEFTKWATDLIAANVGLEIAATNWSQLTFDTFANAYGGSVLFNFDRPAVVLLENEDVYLDLRITSWTDGHQEPSGGFSYLRAKPPMPEPTGDYNGNLVVDAADYTIWRDTLGSTTDLRANGDNTGASMEVIDQADYEYWKARFGNPVLGAASSQALAVPESSVLATLLVGLLTQASARRRASRGPGQGH